MPDLSVLKQVNFGSRVAEDEIDYLEAYFVETSQWAKIVSGDVDIVYGPKGSGKSALYSLLVKRSDSFFDRQIVLIPAEKPRGAAAFQGLRTDPPSSELAFVSMWKLYFVVLLAGKLDEFSVKNEHTVKLFSILESAGLMRGTRGLESLVRAVVDYVRKIKIEANVEVDAATGNPTFGGRISLGEPSEEQRVRGFHSIEELVELCDKAWIESGFSAWLLLDRLDVAFEETSELEQRALRALFKAYIDFIDRNGFRLKIFLRSDIWKRLTKGGFREASHITREVTIRWDEPSLLNLIIKRTLNNPAVCAYYHVSNETRPRNYAQQVKFFQEAFPLQIDQGEKKSSTIVWILGRTKDGTGESAPREIIHLLGAALDSQIRLLELGQTDEEPCLIGRVAFKDGLIEVSKARLEKTIYAEYPRLKSYISQLEGQKTLQVAETLSTIWNCTGQSARVAADELVEIGFFELRGTRVRPQYWVPFLYRDALNMVQGSAAPGITTEE
jgi:hypothetical protein